MQDLNWQTSQDMGHTSLNCKIVGECDTDLGITVNDKDVPHCYASADSDTNGMCTANIELRPGDQVNVKSVIGHGLACVRGDPDGLSGFLGTLIKLL